MGVSIQIVEPIHKAPESLKTQFVSLCIPVYERTPKLLRTEWFIQQTADVKLRLIISEEKQSVVQNRLACLDHVISDFVVFIDDDVLLPPRWLSSLLLVLEHFGCVGAVGPKITSPFLDIQNGSSLMPSNYLMLSGLPGTVLAYSQDRCASCKWHDGYVGSQWEDTDFIMQVNHFANKATVCHSGVWVLHDNPRTNDTPASWEQNKALFHKRWESYLTTGAT